MTGIIIQINDEQLLSYKIDPVQYYPQMIDAVNQAIKSLKSYREDLFETWQSQAICSMDEFVEGDTEKQAFDPIKKLRRESL